MAYLDYRNHHMAVCPNCGYRRYDIRKSKSGFCHECMPEDDKQVFQKGVRGKQKIPVIRDDGMRFESIAEAAHSIKPNAKGIYISNVCRGYQATAYGHTWRFADE